MKSKNVTRYVNNEIVCASEKNFNLMDAISHNAFFMNNILRREASD